MNIGEPEDEIDLSMDVQERNCFFWVEDMPLWMDLAKIDMIFDSVR
jgi:hypothetical protein